jgi:uncharacterized SAM-binding protein YcdF (DUF218 family)
MWISRVVKHLLIPGSMTFLVLGLLVVIVLLYAAPTKRSLADAWLIGLACTYWILSLPVVAHALISGLQGRYGTISSAPDARAARVIVAVGNGSVSYTDGRFTLDQLTRRSTFCVFEAARLYQLLHTDEVIVSGGAPTLGSSARAEADLMREELVKLGVPHERIRVDPTSRTTNAQAANVARLLQQRDPLARAVVVTTAAHMPRVMKLFLAEGIDAVPSVTPDLRYDKGRVGWSRWRPSLVALNGSESAVYEYMALAYLMLGGPRS